MKAKKCVLTISAIDSAGMAGHNMDLRTQNALGVHSLSVITANTAQNNDHVLAINPTPIEAINSQLEALAEIPVDIVKIGLIVNDSQLKAVGEFLKLHSKTVIFDPVLIASNGSELSDAVTESKMIKNLLPECDWITPNIQEAEQLTGIAINSDEDVVRAAKRFLEMNVKNVVIKGGHRKDQLEYSSDYFTNGLTSFWISNPRIKTNHDRGTGCAFSSALASALALDYSIFDSIIVAKMSINQGLKQAISINDVQGPVAISHFPNRHTDLPFLHWPCDKQTEQYQFPDCGDAPLGLYPVVERAEWLERLLPLGISTIQLRVKDLDGSELESEIEKAVSIANRHNCRLFINDHWQIAIDKKAYGVHLGQEDLLEADLKAIEKAGLRLGLSSHCHYEVAAAHRFNPSYIACGPVYSTTTKDMPWTPHDLDGLKYWVDVLDYPVVAIGGINQQRVNGVSNTGVSGTAMITAITLAEDPESTCLALINELNRND